MIELILEIWQTARRNKLRTSLTGFAVAWGIFMLIVLLGAGNGLINAQQDNNDRYVDNSMMVFGGMTSKPYDGLKEGRDIRLDNNDLTTTQSRFTQHVDKAGAVLYESGATITVGENYVSSSLRGVYPMDQDINKREIVAGRFINDIDGTVMYADPEVTEVSVDNAYMVGKFELTKRLETSAGLDGYDPNKVFTYHGALHHPPDDL